MTLYDNGRRVTMVNSLIALNYIEIYFVLSSKISPQYHTIHT